jgi:SsrA-binding protein
MSAKKTQQEAKEEPVIARNRKAGFEYEVLDKFEAGIQLQGSEVKSLRNRDVSINEAFVRPRQGEMWLMGMNIKAYAYAGVDNHDPLRPRRLLMHRREIDKLTGRIAERGFTIVPLTLYWKHGIAKVQLAVVRGRRHYDKREVIKKREAERAMRRASGRRR